MYPNLQVSGSVVHEPETGRDSGFSTAAWNGGIAAMASPIPQKWEVVVGRLSYEDIRRLTCRGTKNRYLPMEPKTSWVLDAGRRSAGGRWHLAGLYGLGAHRIFHAEPRALEPRKTLAGMPWVWWVPLLKHVEFYAEPNLINNKASQKSSWILLIKPSWKAVSIGVSSRLFSGVFGPTVASRNRSNRTWLHYVTLPPKKSTSKNYFFARI